MLKTTELYISCSIILTPPFLGTLGRSVEFFVPKVTNSLIHS